MLPHHVAAYNGRMMRQHITYTCAWVAVLLYYGQYKANGHVLHTSRVLHKQDSTHVETILPMSLPRVLTLARSLTDGHRPRNYGRI
eukprot:scaffold1026_cov409-Prasinococcus_capsulatus_cf.AAC.18